MDWPEIYARLKRDREDGPAWDTLEQVVRSWARPRSYKDRGWHVVDDVVADTCSAVVVSFDAGPRRGDVRWLRPRPLPQLPPARLPRGAAPRIPLTPTFDVPAPEPEDGASEDELRALRHCLSRLPPRELAAVRLRYFEERSSADIAAVLRVTEGNAGRILCLGVARLRSWVLGALPATRVLRAPSLASPAGEATQLTSCTDGSGPSRGPGWGPGPSGTSLSGDRRTSMMYGPPSQGSRRDRDRRWDDVAPPRWARLWSAVGPTTAPHEIDPGALGEYAILLRRRERGNRPGDVPDRRRPPRSGCAGLFRRRTCRPPGLRRGGSAVHAHHPWRRGIGGRTHAGVRYQGQPHARWARPACGGQPQQTETSPVGSISPAT